MAFPPDDTDLNVFTEYPSASGGIMTSLHLPLPPWGDRIKKQNYMLACRITVLDQLKPCTPVALYKSHPPERPSIFGKVAVRILDILNNGTKQSKQTA